MSRANVFTAVLWAWGLTTAPAGAEGKKAGAPLPGTAPLTLQGDIASHLVDGVDRFLLREIDKSVEGRARHWKRTKYAENEYNQQIEPNRKRLAHILGFRDARVPFGSPELVGTVLQPAL